MKKYHLPILALGCITFALIMFHVFRPVSETFYLFQNEDESYKITLSSSRSIASVTQEDQEFIRVLVTMKRDLLDYILPILVTISLITYILLRQFNLSGLLIKDSDMRIVTEHSLYNQFIEENSDRVLLSGEEQIQAYLTWLRGKPIAANKNGSSAQFVWNLEDGQAGVYG